MTKSLQIKPKKYLRDQRLWQKSVDCAEGQLISKCLFGSFNSPPKRTKNFNFTTVVP